MVVLPILSYWVVAAVYDLIDSLSPGAFGGLVGTCRVMRKERGRENKLTKAEVVQRVILQHLIQLALAFGVMLVGGG